MVTIKSAFCKALAIPANDRYMQITLLNTPEIVLNTQKELLDSYLNETFMFPEEKNLNTKLDLERHCKKLFKLEKGKNSIYYAESYDSDILVTLSRDKKSKLFKIDKIYRMPIEAKLLFSF